MRNLLVHLLDIVLGCRHPKDKRGWPRIDLNRGVYHNCLLCGKELPYRNDELVPGSELEVA